MNLTNKIAIVTGGAVGIGKEISMKLASLGAVVVINYRSSAQEANDLLVEMQSLGYKGDLLQGDVSKSDDAQKLFDFTIEQYGRVDIVVNNAGITADNLIIKMKEEDFDSVINTNLKGTWNCCKQAARLMTKQRSGKIINISSVVGVAGNAGQTNYCASKAGIIGLTKSLAREVAKRNVCVNAVAPGFIETKMTQKLPADMVAQYAASIPLARLGKAEDVANLVAFLSSEMSDYITGQVIHVDGGMVMN